MAKTTTPVGKAEAITTTGKEYPLVAPQRKPGQYVGVSINRTGWTDATQRIKVSLMVSLNDGASWREWCSYEDQGGVALWPNGDPVTASLMVASAPPDGARMKLLARAIGKSVQRPLSFVEVA